MQHFDSALANAYDRRQPESFATMTHNLSPEELAEFREIFNLVDRVRLLLC